MIEKRFVKTFCLQINENFIPFWKLDLFEDEDYGEGYKVEGDFQRHYHDLKECYWDIKEKKIVFGKVKEIKGKNEEFFVDEVVYVEISKPYGYFKESIIKEIVYEEYETSIHKIKNLEQYELDMYFTEQEQLELNLEDIYEIRTWKPYWKLDDGEVVKWGFKIKKKFIKNAQQG